MRFSIGSDPRLPDSKYALPGKWAIGMGRDSLVRASAIQVPFPVTRVDSATPSYQKTIPVSSVQVNAMRDETDRRQIDGYC